MAEASPQKIPLVFYRSASGGEPVRDWLLGLDTEERHEVGRDLMRVQWRWPVGMPLCRPMGQRPMGGPNDTGYAEDRPCAVLPS